MKIEKYIRELKKEWDVSKRTRVDKYLGKDWSEERDVTSYYNPFASIWTTHEESAFNGFVQSKFNGIINRVFNER